jgi:hypothetical protein
MVIISQEGLSPTFLADRSDVDKKGDVSMAKMARGGRKRKR